jgi:hypothetical protein
MNENRIRKTPFKFLFELVRLSPREALNVILGNRLFLIEDSEVIRLLCEGYSLARWADGETAIARNKSIGYQSCDPRLADKLNSLIVGKRENLIIGVPSAITERLTPSKWNLLRIQILLSTRVYLSKITNQNIGILCDTFFWYRNYQDLQKIFRAVTQNRRTVLVASNVKYLNFTPTGTKFVETKGTDSFQDYEKISSQIQDVIASSKIPVTILCACGPTSKALVFDFKQFAQVIDVGHGFTFANSGKKIYAWDI